MRAVSLVAGQLAVRSCKVWSQGWEGAGRVGTAGAGRGQQSGAGSREGACPGEGHRGVVRNESNELMSQLVIGRQSQRGPDPGRTHQGGAYKV